MNYKIVIIGDSGVGKTSLMNIFLGNEFNSQQQITIGVDYGIKKINLRENEIKLQIWDTAGQEVFRSISKSYYRGAHGAFVVFDLSRKSTFANVEDWIKELYSQNPNVQVMIIGNKSDVKKQITDDEIEALITKFDSISYVETSAKNKHNIDIMFHNMASKLHCKKIEPRILKDKFDLNYYKKHGCC